MATPADKGGIGKVFVVTLAAFTIGFMVGGETGKSSAEPDRQVRCVGRESSAAAFRQPQAQAQAVAAVRPPASSTACNVLKEVATEAAKAGLEVDPMLDNKEVIPFYVYDGPVHSPDLCYERAGFPGGYVEMNIPRLSYWCSGSEWAIQAKAHPWRVTDPAKARIFVIPLDVCESLATQKKGKCGGKTHIDRVNEIFDAVSQSPWFKRSGGKDHFWSIPHATLPPAMLGKKQWNPKNWKNAFFPNPPQNDLVKNMTIGRYLQYHLTLNDQERVGFKPQQRDWLREEERWGCTTVMPIVTPRPLWSPDTHTFEDWEKRKHFLFFRGNNGMGGGCYMKNGQKARQKAVDYGDKHLSYYGKDTILNNTYADGTAAYYEEIQNSQYCLVFACDDPQTSRFLDSVAAGCIPVVINDAWRVAVAPFKSQINYDRFTITVPESAWMGDPAAAIHLIHHHPRAARKRMYESLLKVRPEILWRHPQSNVATRALREINECFGENFQDQPITV